MRQFKIPVQILSALILSSSPSNASWNGDEKTPGLPFAKPSLSTAPVNVQHELVRYRFQGGMAYRMQAQVLQDASGSRVTNIMCDGELEGHKGNTIVYIEAFALDPNSDHNFQGDYTFMGDLPHPQTLQGLEDGRLLYSDGVNYFIPYVTQEKWEGENKRSVGFFIASYNPKGFSLRLPHTPILAKGLHQLLESKDLDNGREETWKLLGQNPEVLSTQVIPSKTPFVPGLGMTAPKLVTLKGNARQLEELLLNLNLSDQSTHTFLENNCEGGVFIVGHAGSGKSSLMHLLCGHGLKAEPDDIGYLKVSAPKELPGVVIQDGGEVGTKSPTMIFDPQFKRALWDCAGFEDPRGEGQEIINAYTLYKLFKGNIKIILVVTEGDIKDNRGSQFLKRLKKMQEMFPQKQELKELLSLVISRGQLDNPVPLLNNTLVKPSSKMTSDTKELIEALLQNQNRIATFPMPKAEGLYVVNPALQALLTNRQYVPNPKVQPVIGPSGELLILEMAEGLNTYVIDYLKSEGLRQAISFYRMHIDHHRGTTAQLRDIFTSMRKSLQNLKDTHPQSPRAFIKNLSTTINGKDLEKAIEHLEFLQAMKPEVAFRTADWRMALTPMIDYLNLLTQPAALEVSGDARPMVTLRGVFLGVSDLRQAYIAHPNAGHLRVFALNTLFVDEAQALTAPGVCVSLIAPKWQSLHPLNLNLSGVPGNPGGNGANGIDYHGTHGSDGQPGGPGQCAGHFYGQAIAYIGLIVNLTAHGGSGGKGGQGGNGGAGRSGVDATRSPNGVKVSRNARVFMDYFADGTDGMVGGNAGRGGQGGTGGNAGNLFLKDMPPSLFKTLNTPGNQGTHGAPGVVGHGGLHGNHTRFTRLIGYTTRLGHHRVFRALSDRSPAEYLPGDGARGYASNGITPPGLNGEGLQQTTPVALSPRTQEKDFAAWYLTEAANLTMASFLRIFPNLEP